MKTDNDFSLWEKFDIDPARLLDVFHYDPQAPMIFNSGVL